MSHNGWCVFICRLYWSTWNMFRLNSVKNKVMNVSWFKIYFQWGDKKEKNEKRICRKLNPDTFVKYVGTCFMGTIVSLLNGWGQNRPVGTMCKILQKENMIDRDEKGMQCIKCCADIGLMCDPNDQVYVIFEWNNAIKSPSTDTLLSYMCNQACELLVSGSPRIGKSLEVFWAAVKLWEEGNDVIWLNHRERDCIVIFMPAGADHALNFHCIDSKVISENIIHNLGETTMLIHDGWTEQQKGATNLQPEYTQSHQVCVASGHIAVHKTDFQQLSYSSWDLDELVAAMDSSEFIKEMFIRSSMISLYDILAEYFETFIHKEDNDRIEGNTVEFVLDTLAALQKKVREENTLMLDNAKMLLNDKQIILDKLIEWKHYGAGANARHFCQS